MSDTENSPLDLVVDMGNLSEFFKEENSQDVVAQYKDSKLRSNKYKASYIALSNNKTYINNALYNKEADVIDNLRYVVPLEASLMEDNGIFNIIDFPHGIASHDINGQGDLSDHINIKTLLIEAFKRNFNIRKFNNQNIYFTNPVSDDTHPLLYKDGRKNWQDFTLQPSTSLNVFYGSVKHNDSYLHPFVSLLCAMNKDEFIGHSLYEFFTNNTSLSYPALKIFDGLDPDDPEDAVALESLKRRLIYIPIRINLSLKINASMFIDSKRLRTQDDKLVAAPVSQDHGRFIYSDTSEKSIGLSYFLIRDVGFDLVNKIESYRNALENAVIAYDTNLANKKYAIAKFYNKKTMSFKAPQAIYSKAKLTLIDETLKGIKQQFINEVKELMISNLNLNNIWETNFNLAPILTSNDRDKKTVALKANVVHDKIYKEEINKLIANNINGLQNIVDIIHAYGPGISKETYEAKHASGDLRQNPIEKNCGVEFDRHDIMVGINKFDDKFYNRENYNFIFTQDLLDSEINSGLKFGLCIDNISSINVNNYHYRISETIKDKFKNFVDFCGLVHDNSSGSFQVVNYAQDWGTKILEQRSFPPGLYHYRIVAHPYNLCQSLVFKFADPDAYLSDNDATFNLDSLPKILLLEHLFKYGPDLSVYSNEYDNDINLIGFKDSSIKVLFKDSPTEKDSDILFILKDKLGLSYQNIRNKLNEAIIETFYNFKLLKSRYGELDLNTMKPWVSDPDTTSYTKHKFFKIAFYDYTASSKTLVLTLYNNKQNFIIPKIIIEK